MDVHFFRSLACRAALVSLTTPATCADSDAQRPVAAYEAEAVSLRAVERPGGGLYWVRQRPDDVYEVLAEDFGLVAELPVDQDSLRSGTTVRPLGPGYRIDASQPNFLVERTGEFVLQLVYAADGTLLRRTARPRYTTTYRLTDGRFVVQQRDGSTGEEVLIDLQTLAELGRFPERVDYTGIMGEDLWASRAQLAARVYDASFAARSEVGVAPARGDSTPGFAFGLLGVDLGADGLLDFEIRYGDGAEQSGTRYRVFDESGRVVLDTLEPPDVVFAMAPGLDLDAAGDALLIAYGAGASYPYTGGRAVEGSRLNSTAPVPIRTASGTYVAGPRSFGGGTDALVYDSSYALLRVLSPGPLARAVGDTALSSFAFVLTGERGEAYAGAPLAWVSYGDPEDLNDTRYTLTDVEGQVRFTFAAEALAVAESDTAVYLVVDRGGVDRSRRFAVYAGDKARREPGGGTPPPDTTGSGSDTSATVVTEWAEGAGGFAPNPAAGFTSYTGVGTGPVTIELRSSAGQRVRVLREVSADARISLAGLVPGVYVASVRRGDRLLGVTRLVVRTPYP